MPKTSLSDGQRSDRARIAANERWSRLSAAERLEATAPGRRAMFAQFEKQVDPNEVLSPGERARRAENARKAQLARARLKGSKKRQQEKAAMAAARAESTRPKDEVVDSTLAHITRTVPVSDEPRECIAEVMAGGDGDGS